VLKLPRPDQRIFFTLAFFMAIFVAVSNFLVQFPIDYFDLNEVLTYGALTYPVTFLITDLSNRRYGKIKARKIVYFGFILGLSLTLFFSTNFSDLISIRIAIGSGTAFLTAQLLDIHIFDRLRNKIWFLAPIVSSSIGSFIDTMLFFFISFYGTSFNWFNLALGDFSVKLLIALIMLIPFRLLITRLKDVKHYSVETS
tara:strand:- start:13230 stop:13823 length:594 start_codon:yes stop_codon:yes gene_type:complete